MVPTAAEDTELELLLEALYRRYQYDFRGYSRASLKRRLKQALTALDCENLTVLQERLFHQPDFLARLLDYLTVPTTELFRDPAYFLALRREVVPWLRTFPSLKVWVAGCSTGEELYSLAVLLEEEGLLDKTILYATDINPRSLEAARRGIYRAEALRQAGENYRLAGGAASLADYYSAAYDSVRFDPALLRGALISDHSLATDAVFAEVQLVSCRNVLIYFNHTLQDRAVGLFREALIHGGYLGLGEKENLHFSRHREAFDLVCRDERIYRRQ